MVQNIFCGFVAPQLRILAPLGTCQTQAEFYSQNDEVLRLDFGLRIYSQSRGSGLANFWGFVAPQLKILMAPLCTCQRFGRVVWSKIDEVVRLYFGYQEDSLSMEIECGLSLRIIIWLLLG